MKYRNEIPETIYGTAWKEERTADLVFAALQAGFRAIDTANQRKHYFEEAAGQGIQRFLQQGAVKREDLFLQTKFTFARGQDHRKPYDEGDSFTKQVADSFSSSLAHLNTSYLDSYVLHGPYAAGIGAQDLEVWSAMEETYAAGRAKKLGVSNVSAPQLRQLCAEVKVKPAFVQNRCYANVGWDKSVRAICDEEGIAYQGFSLLTANRTELAAPFVVSLAQKYQRTIPQIVFRFCRQIGIIYLTGTTSAQHMKEDLAIGDFDLTSAEVSAFERIGL
jgi:diketogulonate reductase-like aldo/keto reductase